MNWSFRRKLSLLIRVCEPGILDFAGRRGKPEPRFRADFTFRIDRNDGGERVRIEPRLRDAPLDRIVAALKARRADLHIVVTGRNARPEMIDAADLVTEMTLVKHHFAAGVKAQEGIEF